MLTPRIRRLLEQALLEALKNHMAGRDKSKTAAKRKKAGKKRPAKKRTRKAAPRKKVLRRKRA